MSDECMQSVCIEQSAMSACGVPGILDQGVTGSLPHSIRSCPTLVSVPDGNIHTPFTPGQRSRNECTDIESTILTSCEDIPMFCVDYCDPITVTWVNSVGACPGCPTSAERSNYRDTAHWVTKRSAVCNASWPSSGVYVTSPCIAPCATVSNKKKYSRDRTGQHQLQLQ